MPVPRCKLFAAEGDENVTGRTSENNLAVLDRFYLELVTLGAGAETELLALLHRFAVDDGKARSLLEGDGSEKECAQWNIAGGAAIGVLELRARLKADRPEWIAAAAVHLKGGFVFDLERWMIVGKRAAENERAQKQRRDGYFHFFSIRLAAASSMCWNCGVSGEAWMLRRVTQRSGSLFSRSAMARPSVP